jgi:hypothetical protein
MYGVNDTPKQITLPYTSSGSKKVKQPQTGLSMQKYTFECAKSIGEPCFTQKTYTPCCWPDLGLGCQEFIACAVDVHDFDTWVGSK